MHVPPLVIGASETVQRATMKMFVDGTRFLVVVGEGGSILGVVTRIDLIKGIRWRDVT
jgi:CBS domain-containing protein